MRVMETCARVRAVRGVDRANERVGIVVTCAYDGETRERATMRRTKRRGEWWCVFDEDEDEDDDEDDDDATAWTCRWRRSEGRRKVLRRSDAGVRVEVRGGDGKTYGFCVAKVTGGGDGERGEDAARWVALRGKRANGRAEGLIETWERALGSEGKAVGEREMGEERAARATRTPPKTNGSKSNETRNGTTRDASDDEATLPAFGASNTNDSREGTGSSATHAFALTVRVESFEASRDEATFDFDSSVVARVGLDDAFAEFLGISRKRAECMVRTGPSVDGEGIVAFPEGEDFVEFACAPAALATALARKPLLLLDVWSATDENCVATAEIAMDELLRRPEVRYRAEVTDDEDVVVGRVRLRVRLDERGSGTARHGGDASAATEERDGAMVRSRVLSPAPVPSAQKPPPPAKRAQTRHVSAPSKAERAVGETDPRSGVEYKVAYDLEVWKQHQMTKFYEEMRTKELTRMKILEDEWRRHESRRAREAEEAAKRSHAMEKKLHEVAIAFENRERKLVELEETFEHRKHKLERETSRLREEAADSVRRNQETCNHRVEMEKQKAREALRERDALHRRLEHAETQLLEVESAFAAHKKAHLETNEAAMQAELSRLAPRCEAAEAQVTEELEAKERYKEQLSKMARQVVALERERAHLRRAIERAGLNVSGRAHAAPSANEFLHEVLSGENGEADAFMKSFSMDVAAVSGNTQTSARARASHVAPSKRAISEKLEHPRNDVATRDVAYERESRDPVASAPPIEFPIADASLGDKRAAEKEVRRLVSERGELMRTGLYGSSDRIVRIIDERIEELTDRIASA